MASIVTVQVGQAGNQMGFEYLDTVARTALNDAGHAADHDGLNQHFVEERDGSRTARAVAVDMEPKVIATVVRKAIRGGVWSYHSDCGYAGARGAGNNWARGYGADGPAAGPAVLELVRKQVERCDTFSGFVMQMSVAGGTGSGVGTRLTEMLRDTYPREAIMNQIVWPYAAGEVIVQNYNAVLSLSRLAKASDAVVVVENDAMHDVCSRILGTKNISIEALNAEIARHIAGFLCPARGMDPVGDGAVLADLNDGGLPDLLQTLCPHPDYKLLTVQSIPQMADTHRAFANYHWPSLLKTAKQMLATGWPCQEGLNWRKPSQGPPQGERNRVLASAVTLRGSTLKDAPLTEFPPTDCYVEWSPVRNRCRGSPFRLVEHDKSVTVLSNSSRVWKPIEQCTSRAWGTFVSRAFLHQYSKYGTSEDDFVDSFVQVEQIIKNYHELCK